MVAAADDQRDPLPDSHAGELAPVGQFQGHRQLLGGVEGDRILHRQGGDAGGPGQDASVGHKGAQPQLGQHVPNGLLVLCQIGNGLEPCLVQIAEEQAGLHTPGKQVKENFLQLPGIDGAAVGGKTHLQAQDDLTSVGVELTGGALQHLLAAAADGDEAAVS